MKRPFVFPACVLIAVTATALRPARAAEASADYAEVVARAREHRREQLLDPNGWLSLVGRDLIKLGENTVGSDDANAIKLVRGPAFLGRLIRNAKGEIRLELAADAKVLAGGQPVTNAIMRSDSGGVAQPTVVTFGTLSCSIIERSGMEMDQLTKRPVPTRLFFLRTNDTDSGLRARFVGIDYFPVDPSWRIEARWVLELPQRVLISNSLGQVIPALVTGKAVFEYQGKPAQLLGIDAGPDEPFRFVFADDTSGGETEDTGRFLFTERPSNGKVVLDFNLAENPPCAFNPLGVCAIPSKENRLPFAVTAGEKKYRGDLKYWVAAR